MSSMPPDIEGRALTARKVLTQEIYKNKCAHPSPYDILNGIYELQYEDACLIHQFWHEDDAVLGAAIRKRLKRDFWEVAEIKAMDQLDSNEEVSNKALEDAYKQAHRFYSFIQKYSLEIEQLNKIFLKEISS